MSEPMHSFLIELKKSRKLMRLTVVGDGAVGKTSLVDAITKFTTTESDASCEDFSSDINIKRTPFMTIESWHYRDMVVQCYDLAGQRTEGVHPLDLLSEQVLGHIDIVVYVFSLAQFSTFENLHLWLDLVRAQNAINKTENISILVGNKADLGKEIPDDMIQNLVGEGKPFSAYIECIAIQGKGIKELMETIFDLGKKVIEP